MRHEQGASQGDGRAAKANTYIGICAGEDYQDPEEISGVDFRPSKARRSRFSGRYDFKILKGKSPKSPPATRRDNAARAGVSAAGPSLVRTLRGKGVASCAVAPWCMWPCSFCWLNLHPRGKTFGTGEYVLKKHS